MITPETKNDIIKESIVLPENCHCTNRTILTDSTARAVSKKLGVVRANLLWQHKANGDVRVVWQTPFQSTHFRIIRHADTEEEFRENANAALLDGNVQMDANYNEATDDG